MGQLLDVTLRDGICKRRHFYNLLWPHAARGMKALPAQGPVRKEEAESY